MYFSSFPTLCLSVIVAFAHHFAKHPQQQQQLRPHRHHQRLQQVLEWNASVARSTDHLGSLAAVRLAPMSIPGMLSSASDPVVPPIVRACVGAPSSPTGT